MHRDAADAPPPARQLSRVDEALAMATRALRTLAARRPPQRPAPRVDAPPLSADDRRRSLALMRVNHAGEVCAQALYEGQALSARSPTLKGTLREMAREEDDHLAWCAERIDHLGGRASALNPLWFGASFALGVAVGRLGERWNLGFVAATEERVCEHLRDHLGRLPAADHASRATLERMLEDEAGHGDRALREGGTRLPDAVRGAMARLSKPMTTLSLWF